MFHKNCDTKSKRVGVAGKKLLRSGKFCNSCGQVAKLIRRQVWMRKQKCNDKLGRKFCQWTKNWKTKKNKKINVQKFETKKLNPTAKIPADKSVSCYEKCFPGEWIKKNY